MRAVAWPLVGWLGVVGACTVTAGSSDVLRPERDVEAVAEVAAATNEAAPPADGEATTGEKDGFDLDTYKDAQREADGASPTKGDLEALRAELGVTGEAPPAEATAPIPSVVPVGPGRWTPMTPITLGWGLRLVSTVDAASPPRAILGLPDGREEVVKAGDLLPEVGVVVLAIGQGVVQVAQVTGDGDVARVESVFLQAMYPASAPVASVVVAPAAPAAPAPRPR